MKSAFLLANKNNIYISQFLGDLSTYDSQTTYDNVLQHYLKISGISPEIIVRDKHPLYFFPKVTNEFKGAKLITVQHHKANFCAGLFENDLMESKEPVLGIIWDGVGLGDDQRMWGGEFFLYENRQISRIHFFKYFDYLLGDKMSLQPRIAALSLCKNLKAADSILKHKFSNVEWTLYKKMLEKHSTIQTSSMGRIFDAVASLLGLRDVNSYEGESAMLLEDQAYRFYKQKGLDWNGCYIFEKKPEVSLSIDTVLTGIIEDINGGMEVEMIAAKFHFTLVKMIESIIEKRRVKSLVFSGGVFQNGLLVDLIQHHLAGKYSLYFQKNVSPNDENIALGQMAYYLYMDDGQK
jgi:hydrogenase maturation protein HypF